MKLSFSKGHNLPLATVISATFILTAVVGISALKHWQHQKETAGALMDSHATSVLQLVTSYLEAAGDVISSDAAWRTISRKIMAEKGISYLIILGEAGRAVRLSGPEWIEAADFLHLVIMPVCAYNALESVYKHHTRVYRVPCFDVRVTAEHMARVNHDLQVNGISRGEYFRNAVKSTQGSLPLASTPIYV